jgi:hypothetical protein
LWGLADCYHSVVCLMYNVRGRTMSVRYALALCR